MLEMGLGVRSRSCISDSMSQLLERTWGPWLLLQALALALCGHFTGWVLVSTPST